MPSPLTQSRNEWLRLYSLDVATNPDCYKPTVVADPQAHAAQIIEGLDLTEIRQLTRDLRQEMRAVAQLTGRS